MDLYIVKEYSAAQRKIVNDDFPSYKRNLRISLKILVLTIWISITASIFLIKRTIKIGVYEFSALYSLIVFLVLILILLIITLIRREKLLSIIYVVLNSCFCLNFFAFLNFYEQEVNLTMFNGDFISNLICLIFVLALIYLYLTKYLCIEKEFKHLAIVSAVYGLMFILVLFCTFYFYNAGLKYFFIVVLYFVSVYLHSLVTSLESEKEFNFDAVLCELLILTQLLVGYFIFKELQEPGFNLFK